MRHIALLRGINVGRAKRVAMADLRALLTGLGLRDVRTLLNSGNAVFGMSAGAASELAVEIEAAMTADLDVSARVIVLSAAELETIVVENPLLELAVEPARLLVGILASEADRERVLPLTERDWSPDAFALGRRAGYLWCATGILESELAKSFNRLLGDAVTTRNWSTVLKLRAMVETA